MTQVRHLAQFNIARIKYPLDDARMREFVDNVERVNGLADKIEGFVWRLQDESGHAMNMTVYNDPRVLPNLTVWESAEALERFVFKTLHGRFFARRAEWFEQPDPTLVMWWIPENHRPTMDEGVERLEYLKARGPSDYAFGWDQLPATQHWKTARGARDGKLPSPSWGGVGGGGPRKKMYRRDLSLLPPSLTLPHKGGGNRLCNASTPSERKRVGEIK
jgi:heme-degrading monooxygenase HmoA